MKRTDATDVPRAPLLRWWDAYRHALCIPHEIRTSERGPVILVTGTTAASWWATCLVTNQKLKATLGINARSVKQISTGQIQIDARSGCSVKSLSGTESFQFGNFDAAKRWVIYFKPTACHIFGPWLGLKAPIIRVLQ